MVSKKSDPVLITVGVILIIAVIAGIGASIIIHSEPSLKVVKYTSTEKAFDESPCCKGQGSIQTKCGGLNNSKSPCCMEQGSLSARCGGAKKSGCQKVCIGGQGNCSGNSPAICRNN
ncbi:MAG: hypothetical protein V1862_06625 [Methanobacteriota archaeon]